MGYSLNKLKQELTAKDYADEGLVAWGNSASGGLFGGAGAAFGGMHVISKKGDSILVIPFTNKEILYDKSCAFEKANISSASVKGLLSKSLIIKTTDNKEFKYAITQGAGDVKTILQKLGL